MGLKEFLANFRNRSSVPSKSSQSVVVEHIGFVRDSRNSRDRTVALFPEAKMDFSDGILGENGQDLSNAFGQGVVVKGDVLEITTAYRPADEQGRGTRLLYLEPDHFMFGGMEGEHKFFPERPYKGMPDVMLEGFITSWKKVGHITPDEWKIMMAEVFEGRIIIDVNAGTSETP